MVPHYSGTTLDAQARYANGVKNILLNYFEGKPQDPQNVIVGIGKSDQSPTPVSFLTLSQLLGKYETKACEYKCLFQGVTFHRCWLQMVNAEGAEALQQFAQRMAVTQIFNQLQRFVEYVKLQ
jgi:hypothetical protein